jgi:hypothetical protein
VNLVPARNATHFGDSRFVWHWAASHIRGGTPLWLFRFLGVGLSYYLAFSEVSNLRVKHFLREFFERGTSTVRLDIPVCVPTSHEERLCYNRARN